MKKQYFARWLAGVLISGSMYGAFVLLGINPIAGLLIGTALSIHGELAATKVE